MPKSILTIISKDGNATEYYEKCVVTHISKMGDPKMEPHKEKFPKLYFYKFVIAYLGKNRWIYFHGIFHLDNKPCSAHFESSCVKDNKPYP